MGAKYSKDFRGLETRFGREFDSTPDHLPLSSEPRSMNARGGNAAVPGLVAVCWIGSDNLNAWMVFQGWAVAYRRFSTDYVLHEDSAKNARRGIWRGRFIMPWKWRRGDRLVRER